MGEVSHIAWTDATFNPWWGCTRVSPGCENCYAEQLATVRRKLPVWGVDAERKPMSEAYWREPLKWERKAAADGERRRVFCASMADVFEFAPERNTAARRVIDDGRARLWDLIRATPNLDWLLLTKRPENVSKLVPWADAWPANVWLGTTAEDQKRLEQRIVHLLDLHAAVRFLSIEPQLEAIDLTSVDVFGCGSRDPEARLNALTGEATDYRLEFDGRHVDWVITGGESGSGARSYAVEWAADIVAQCAGASVPVFVKQLGAFVRWDGTERPGEYWPNGGPGEAAESMSQDPNYDGLGWRVRLKDRKGGDPAEWPEHLRVREFPR